MFSRNDENVRWRFWTDVAKRDCVIVLNDNVRGNLAFRDPTKETVLWHSSSVVGGLEIFAHRSRPSHGCNSRGLESEHCGRKSNGSKSAIDHLLTFVVRETSLGPDSNHYWETAV